MTVRTFDAPFKPPQPTPEAELRELVQDLWRFIEDEGSYSFDMRNVRVFELRQRVRGVHPDID